MSHIEARTEPTQPRSSPQRVRVTKQAPGSWSYSKGARLFFIP
jgi:hypothetical protein